MDFLDPVVTVERLTAERNGHTDGAIIDELRALAPLPDEDDASWDQDEVWLRCYLLIALATHVAARRLEEGVYMEKAVAPDWSRLTSICVPRCTSERAGTRHIDQPKIEAELAGAIRQLRDTPSAESRVGLLLEVLLGECLGECPEWDGKGISDGLLDEVTTSPRRRGSRFAAQ